MHRLLDNTLRSLRQDLGSRLGEAAVESACREAGHRWRPCLLTPSALIRWFLIQGIKGDILAGD